MHGTWQQTVMEPTLAGLVGKNIEWLDVKKQTQPSSNVSTVTKMDTHHVIAHAPNS